MEHHALLHVDMRMKISVIATVLALVAILPLQLFAQGREIDLGVIERRGAQSESRPVAIVSTDARIQSLLRRAFQVHGAYELTAREQADFVFRFEPLAEDQIRLTIESGQPGRVLFSREVSGSSRNDAALRAGDIAVARTNEDLPGFFAARMAFISDRSGATELYHSDIFFTEVRQLTGDRAISAFPSLAPDGRKILYTGYYRSGSPDVFLIDVASGRRTVFAGFRGTNTGGAWNPRGDRVALILSGTGNSELYVSNAEGRNIRRLTNTKSLESDPSWSPDGRRIVYASDAPGRPQLFILPVDGGSPRRIPTNISGYCAEPAWNPRDENLIAFTIASGTRFEIALYDFRANQSRILTSGPSDSLGPEWARDGRHLIYTERTAQSRRLMIIDTVTGRKSPLHSSDFGNAWQGSLAYGE